MVGTEIRPIHESGQSDQASEGMWLRMSEGLDSDPMSEDFDRPSLQSLNHQTTSKKRALGSRGERTPPSHEERATGCYIP